MNKCVFVASVIVAELFVSPAHSFDPIAAVNGSLTLTQVMQQVGDSWGTLRFQSSFTEDYSGGASMLVSSSGPPRQLLFFCNGKLRALLSTVPLADVVETLSEVAPISPSVEANVWFGSRSTNLVFPEKDLGVEIAHEAGSMATIAYPVSEASDLGFFRRCDSGELD